MFAQMKLTELLSQEFVNNPLIAQQTTLVTLSQNSVYLIVHQLNKHMQIMIQKDVINNVLQEHMPIIQHIDVFLFVLKTLLILDMIINVLPAAQMELMLTILQDYVCNHFNVTI